jgi:hypothetical protein
MFASSRTHALSVVASNHLGPSGGASLALSVASLADADGAWRRTAKAATGGSDRILDGQLALARGAGMVRAVLTYSA